MNKTDTKKYKEKLITLRARLRGDVQQLTTKALSSANATGDGAPSHLADAGTDSWERDFSLQFAQNDQEVLKEIAEALERIEDGTFGLCQDCVEEGKARSKCGIAKTRLNAIPYARNCIECKRRREELL
jgi:DnaK suppressor protein